MKLLVIGKEGRLVKYTLDSSVYKGIEICYAAPGTSDEDILKIGGDADFILVDAISKVSENMINNMPNLKLIHSEGVAFNAIDIEAAKKKKVYVCNCKGMNATAVAEQAVLLMLGLLRGICTGDASVRMGTQIKTKESYMIEGSLKELGECTVGLVGFGDIAKAAAKLLKAFGAKIVYYNRHRASEEIEKTYEATYMPLVELLAVSDIVSIHLPVTSETEKMVDKTFLNQMKKGSYLINTARGELIDGEALLDAVRSGHLAGAGLDTITGEPIQKDNIMLTAEKEVEDRLLFSCHVGGITAASFCRGYEMVWSDIKKVMDGEEPDHVVNSWK